MKYENLFLNIPESEKHLINQEIRLYLRTKSIPAFSNLGRYKRIYIDCGNELKFDGMAFFERDLEEYIKQFALNENAIDMGKYKIRYEEYKEWDFKIFYHEKDVTDEMKNNLVIAMFYEIIKKTG